jgi:hypothetical protein
MGLGTRTLAELSWYKDVSAGLNDPAYPDYAGGFLPTPVVWPTDIDSKDTCGFIAQAILKRG